MPDNEPHRNPGSIKWRSFVIYVLLTVSTLSVYLQAVNFEFIIMDDGDYISRIVQQGLIIENILWSATAKIAANWHPLTMISHMLDCQLYGLNSGLHHLTSLFFHIANTLLLFFVLRRLTGLLWHCAFVAALFALHPLHVESVAWIAERKDVLSTFFWMLTLWAYVRYVERPGALKYLPVLVFFALGLMAKPMLVTLPFVLLLLDYWPLKRIQLDRTGNGTTEQKTSLLQVVFEKIPLLSLAAASCIVTYKFQQNAILGYDTVSLYGRIANASVSYIHYIIKMIWPFNLVAFYPHPGILPLWQVLMAITVLVFVTYAVLRSMHRYPFLCVGWFWYVGTLVPVIGLVQVGEQAMADRYTYVPLIGIFIMMAWGVPELMTKWQHRNKILMSFGMAVILILMPITVIQITYWQNSISLFQHALDVTDENYVAHNNLALPLAKQGKTDEAIKHFNAVLKINPGYFMTHFNLGELLAKQDRTNEAIKHYREGLKIYPGDAMAHHSFGELLEKQGKTDEAIKHYGLALRINPASKSTHTALGAALARHGNYLRAIEHLNTGLNDATKVQLMLGKISWQQGREKESIQHYTEAIRINPNNTTPYKMLGDILKRQGKIKEAIAHYSTAIKLDPGFKEARVSLGKAHFVMGNILVGKGELSEAIDHFQDSLQLNYNFAQAHTNLGYALLTQGREDEAQQHFHEAILIDPEKSINAYYNLACLNARRNDINESVAWLKKAIDKGFDDWNTIKTDKDLENIRNTAYYVEMAKSKISAGKAPRNKE